MGHTVVVVGLIYLLHINLEIQKKKNFFFEWSQCCLTPNCKWKSRHSGSDGQRHDATSLEWLPLKPYYILFYSPLRSLRGLIYLLYAYVYDNHPDKNRIFLLQQPKFCRGKKKKSGWSARTHLGLSGSRT